MFKTNNKSTICSCVNQQGNSNRIDFKCLCYHPVFLLLVTFIFHRKCQLNNDFSPRIAQFENMTDNYKESKSGERSQSVFCTI